MSSPASKAQLGRLTSRDLAMLHSLEQARFLTPQALEWLHFPQWRERWQRYAERRGEQLGARYKAANRLYYRLKQLRDAGLVMQLVRPVAYGVDLFRRDADAYALTEQGAVVVAQERGCELATLSWETRRVRSTQTLPHSVDIGVFYAAMRAKIEATTGLSLEGWQGDHLLARPGQYDRLPVAMKRGNGATMIEVLPVLPDATFVIRSERGAVRCFVEIDRGRPIRTWKQKIAAYHAYTGSRELRQRYDVGGFMLLVVTHNSAYRQRLMEATAEILEQPSDRCLFMTNEDVHPTTIGNQWHKLVGLERQAGRPTVPGGMAVSYRIETMTHTFVQ